MTSPTDELERRIEGVARTAWEGARSLLFIVLTAGWGLAWASILLFGWIFSIPALVWVAGIVLGASAVGLVAGRIVRRSRLQRRAKRELVARAKLDGVKIDRGMEDVLKAFDHEYGRALAVLDRPSSDVDAVEAAANLERVRERLYQTAIEKAQVVRRARQISGGSNIEVVRASVENAKSEAADKQREAERITGDAQRLASRLSELRRLSAAGGREAASLGPVLEDLERTASAYREIEQAESDTEQKLRALRSARKEMG